MRGFLVLLLVTIVSSQKITVYDNFEDGSIKFGPEEIVTDYLTINSGNATGSLPKSFTVCSSVWIKFKTTDISFFQIYKNEQPWFNFLLMEMHSEHKGEIYFGGYIMVIDDSVLIPMEKQTILVSPHSWAHGCLSVDTISGELLVIINGITIFNDISEPLVNTFGDINGQIDLFKVRVY